MKHFVLLVLLGLSFSSLMHKDNAEFKGKVVDDQTGGVLPFADVVHLRTNQSIQTDIDGIFRFTFILAVGDSLQVSHSGYETKIHQVTSDLFCEIRLSPIVSTKEVLATGKNELRKIQTREEFIAADAISNTSISHRPPSACYQELPRANESYEKINENDFVSISEKPLSTFSIDVDGAAFSNVRRFINQGQKPPTDAVRVEELINYFDYNYGVNPKSNPFDLHYELGSCPWNADHQLLHIGLQGVDFEPDEIPSSNLVFLIDVSGSMRHANKLPLLIQSFKMLVRQLDENDKISIVTYAGRAGVILEPTSGNHKTKIINALEGLQAGGSTAGAQGIITAYSLAQEHFIRDGNNRVILATDGDFNVGIQRDEDLVKLIEEKRNHGIFLNVLGFGMGNYKDSKMQRLANNGNGIHAYIDNIHEARKVFVDELNASLVTIAKDVKIQIEFNPAYVKYYRLIGYENRALADRDFNDDRKDAGEIGAGHSVTVLYEIVPAGSKSTINNVDPLKYQENIIESTGILNGELANLKIRHKDPHDTKSEKQVWALSMKEKTALSNHFYWSAAMACFGMTLRNSDHLADGDYNLALELAIKGKGSDTWGYRAEAISLMRSAQALFDGSEETHSLE